MKKAIPVVVWLFKSWFSGAVRLVVPGAFGIEQDDWRTKGHEPSRHNAKAFLPRMADSPICAAAKEAKGNTGQRTTPHH